MKNIFIMLCFFILFVSCSNTNIANTNNTNVIMSTNEDGSIVFEQKDVVYNIDYKPNVVYANKDNTDLNRQIAFFKNDFLSDIKAFLDTV